MISCGEFHQTVARVAKAFRSKSFFPSSRPSSGALDLVEKAVRLFHVYLMAI